MPPELVVPELVVPPELGVVPPELGVVQPALLQVRPAPMVHGIPRLSVRPGGDSVLGVARLFQVTLQWFHLG